MAMLKFYKFYFEKLAADDALIAHTKNNPGYFYIRDHYNPEAFDNALKDAGAGAKILLEPYSHKGNDGNNRNYIKQMQGRFNILLKGNIGDQESIELAEETAETIAEDIVAKMREKFEQGSVIEIAPGNTSPVVFFKIVDVTFDPIGPISTNYFGLSVGFTMSTRLSGKSNPANWPVL